MRVSLCYRVDRASLDASGAVVIEQFTPLYATIHREAGMGFEKLREASRELSETTLAVERCQERLDSARREYELKQRDMETLMLAIEKGNKRLTAILRQEPHDASSLALSADQRRLVHFYQPAQPPKLESTPS